VRPAHHAQWVAGFFALQHQSGPQCTIANLIVSRVVLERNDAVEADRRAALGIHDIPQRVVVEVIQACNSGL
jgi:hypothetical protein